jgi:hypothetical protein
MQQSIAQDEEVEMIKPENKTDNIYKFDHLILGENILLIQELKDISLLKRKVDFLW